MWLKMKTKAICHDSVPVRAGMMERIWMASWKLKWNALLYPDGQLDLLLPPQQHPRVVGSHTLEEVSVYGQNSASQRRAPVKGTTPERIFMSVDSELSFTATERTNGSQPRAAVLKLFCIKSNRSWLAESSSKLLYFHEQTEENYIIKLSLFSW